MGYNVPRQRFESIKVIFKLENKRAVVADLPEV